MIGTADENAEKQRRRIDIAASTLFGLPDAARLLAGGLSRHAANLTWPDLDPTSHEMSGTRSTSVVGHHLRI